jgi:hypothetical protein
MEENEDNILNEMLVIQTEIRDILKGIRADNGLLKPDKSVECPEFDLVTEGYNPEF